MYLMPLSCTLTNDKNGTIYVMYILPQYKFFSNQKGRERELALFTLPVSLCWLRLSARDPSPDTQSSLRASGMGLEPGCSQAPRKCMFPWQPNNSHIGFFSPLLRVAQGQPSPSTASADSKRVSKMRRQVTHILESPREVSGPN